MTKRQKQEIIYTLVNRRETGRQLRNEADKIVRHADKEIAVVLALPERKRRAAGTVRQVNQVATPSVPQPVTGRKPEILSDSLAYVRGLMRAMDDALSTGNGVRAAVLAGEVEMLVSSLVQGGRDGH